jgi:ATP-binding cassette subfamily C (CFTR/MRP) protein 1
MGSSAPEGGKYQLIFVLFKLFKWEILVPIFPRLCLVLFTICQPLLINRYLEFLQDPTESMSIGYGLLGAYGVVYFGLAVCFILEISWITVC